MCHLPFRSRLAAAALLLWSLWSASAIAAVPANIHLTSYVSSGIKDPVAIQSPRDGSGRMFIVERGGALRVVVNGQLQSEPYYSRSVDTGDVERGMLGLAFDPDFKTNGTLYVTYTAPGASGEILRRLVAKDPAANVFKGKDDEVMSLPLFYNHNGGDIHFGPDNYLYWSTGSGTGSFDPEDLAQSLWKKDIGNRTYSMMGKILRIDVRKSGKSSGTLCGPKGEYSIPADNPYVDAKEACAEIWLYGFRNPWRFSFDRQTGDLWIGDVGEGKWEEIDMRPAGATGNRNYGYPACEGDQHGRPDGSGSNCPAETGTVGPVMQYSHDDSRCSVSGGYVYRGPIASLQGRYIFGDACTSELFIGTQSNGKWTFEPFPSGIKPGYGTIAAFGEGEDGTLYVVDHLNSQVWRFDEKKPGKDATSYSTERTFGAPIAAAAMLVWNLVTTPASAGIPADLTLTPYITSGITEPVAIRSPGDGSGRMFIVERGGALRVVANGQLLSTPYYTRSVDTGDVERGLLGLAFDPNFESNGTLYIVYTASGASGEILRRLVATNPAANVFSGTDTEIMHIPLFYNHNGGDIHFGPDNYLYWSTGSGTGSFDPENLAQDLWKRDIGGTTYYLMGKVLRIDVRTPDPSAAANMCGAEPGQPAQYSIPSDNPYADASQACGEIWLFGFRNPWRFSIDRLNGNLFIGDVGEGSYEEIDMYPSPGAPPPPNNRNYGYPACEGDHHGRPAGSGSNCPAETGTVGPIMQYAHEDSRCSISGGVRYRGPITGLQGNYVFADACTSEIFIGTQSGSAWTYEVFDGGIAPGYGTVSAFGEGEDGTLYAVNHQAGEILRFDGDEVVIDEIFANGFDPN